MDIQKYLSRIKFSGDLKPDFDTLRSLHKHHLLYVPFEDLDIHYKRPFDLKLENIYHKVVDNKRGGFCYEVNSLFNELLKAIEFKTKIVSGKVIRDSGEQGPEYDHMAIVIQLDKTYIADVGFGDLFLEPLEIIDGVQYDGRNFFRIEYSNDEYAIYMSVNNTDFKKEYTFTLTETPIELFEESCRDKQVNTESFFVNNVICSKPTWQGRITVYNDKFIETIAYKKTETPIANDHELREILRQRFDIEIKL